MRKCMEIVQRYEKEKRPHFIDRQHKKLNYIICANRSCLVALVYMIIEKFIINRNIVIFDSLLTVANAFAISIILIYIFNVMPVLNNKFFIFTGKNSLIIYLLHTYLVTACRAVVLRAGINNPMAAVAICIVVPLAINIGIIVIINKVPILSYIFRPINLIDKIKKKQG